MTELEKEMLEYFIDMEWKGFLCWSGRNRECCPSCHSFPDEDHAENCRHKVLLQKLLTAQAEETVIQRIIKSQKDLDPKYDRLISEHFDELISRPEQTEEAKLEERWERAVEKVQNKLTEIKCGYALYPSGTLGKRCLYERATELALMLRLRAAGDDSIALLLAMEEAVK